MAVKQTEEFRREAVRIALTSGLPRGRVASDLGVGKSTLSHWISQYRPSLPGFACLPTGISRLGF